MPFKDAARQRDYQARWAARRRAEFFDGKACAWCHSTTDLQLHHRDPNEKASHRIWTWSWERIEAEAAKCIVVCGPCHRRAHADARRVEAELRHPHGTMQRYRLGDGCKCEPCREARREFERSRRQQVAA